MPSVSKWSIAFAIGILLLWLGWIVPVFLSTFHILLCIVLVLIILMQSGSATDLAGAFGGAGSQTAFGPRSSATFLTKATVWCATMFMLTSLALSVHQSPGVPGINSVLSKTVASQSSQPAKQATAPAKPKPALPVHLPSTTPTVPAAPAKH
ncbi:MAG TPA: preprotein translocase subunit SecG [Candidatus Dormibacteraeota bacterium]|nr:preprotein translocase subunit SecG [Candidatus Dormibacteraeota bacterium]